MFPKVTPKDTKAWQELQNHYDKEMKGVHMRSLFAAEPNRFSHHSLKLDDILFDYSKNIFNEKTLELLRSLAVESKVKEAMEAMFSGEKINMTENRSVLHTALRNLSGTPVYSDGKDVMPDVLRVLKQMKDFSARIHSGEWKGYTGK